MNPKFVRIEQGLLDWKKPDMLFTLNNIYELAVDINMTSKIETFDEEPTARWGTGVYKVEDTGALVYLKDKFDTSG